VTQPVFSHLDDSGNAALARHRLHPLQRAVRAFGFHGATLDLRQNSDVFEAVVAELLPALTQGQATSMPQMARAGQEPASTHHRLHPHCRRSHNCPPATWHRSNSIPPGAACR